MKTTNKSNRHEILKQKDASSLSLLKKWSWKPTSYTPIVCELVVDVCYDELPPDTLPQPAKDQAPIKPKKKTLLDLVQEKNAELNKRAENKKAMLNKSLPKYK